MTYPETLRFLASLGHELRGQKFGLEAITAILDSLGNPHRSYPTAIVAGTNGKGSTSAMLASILSSAGYRTGLYTSPHLIRVNERIRVAGRDIEDDDFASAFSDVCAAVEELTAAGRIESRPSFFEYLTATGFLAFRRAKVEFAVFEVGMGGRLDATNVTEPRVAVITSIALDHEEFLGATHTEIAAEKAGVIRAGRPVVSTAGHPDASRVIRQRCAALGAPLVEIEASNQVSALTEHEGRFEFDWTFGGETLRVTPPLPGRFQVENAAAAAAAARLLMQQGFSILNEAVVQGIARTKWPGRLETVHEQPLVLLDGAHNPAAARAVADFVREQLAGRTLRLVYASMRDKAVGEITSILFPLAEEVILTRPVLPRAASAEEIQAAAPARNGAVVICSDPVRAVERAVEACAPEDVVLVCGSLYLVGAVKEALAEGKLGFLRGIERAATARS
jgi:dihydrofolate synthase/folylpolyglutamate synthase